MGDMKPNTILQAFLDKNALGSEQRVSIEALLEPRADPTLAFYMDASRVESIVGRKRATAVLLLRHAFQNSGAGSSEQTLARQF